MHRILTILLITVLSQSVFAATNTITSVTNSIDRGTNVLQFNLEQPVNTDPSNFTASLTKIVIELDYTNSQVPRTTNIDNGNVTSVNIVQTDDRARIVINLKTQTTYKILTDNNKLYILIDPVRQPEITMISTKTVEDLILIVRQIIARGTQLQDAIEPLNAILMLAPGTYTEEAQEVIGLIYERTRQYERAKTEDKLFLALYPNSLSYTRVKERLIALEIAEPAEKTNILGEKKPRLGKDTRTEASIAEYYVTGISSMDGKPYVEDQSSLISNIRASAMFRDDQYQLSLAYRQSKINNFLNSASNKDILSLGYIDLKDTFKQQQIRIGRQNAVNGVIGRFDGIYAAANIDDDTRVSVVTGIPYIGQTNTSRQFYGADAETMFDNKWSGDIYYNYQLADNIPERSAIGANLRYFYNNISVLQSIEYDILYNALNSVTVQGNAQFDPYGIYFLYDRRKSPMLFAERAVMLGLNSPMRQPYGSVGDAFSNSGLSTSDIYKFINSSTSTSNAYVIGLSKQLNTIWNVSVDYQVTNMSAANDTSFIPTEDNPFSLIQQPATSDTQSLNFHALGTDVLVKGHTVNALLMFSDDGASTMYTVTLLNGIQLTNVRFDLLLMYFNRNQLLSVMTSTTASIRANYKLQSSSIEAQLSATDNSTYDKMSSTLSKSSSISLVLGWKIDF